MNLSSEEVLSDDEIFFGKMTLKEVKRRIFFRSSDDRHSLPATNKISTEETKDNDENNLQIIEINSEPDISYVKPSLGSPDSIANVSKSNWDVDDSFLTLEKLVSEMCESPKSYNELDNTLEVVEYILNNPTTKDRCSPNTDDLKHDLRCHEPIIKESKDNVLNRCEHVDLCKAKVEIIKDEKDKVKLLQETPSHIKVENYVKTDTLDTSIVATPNKQTEHIFKTPKKLLSTKKQIPNSSTKKTPNKVNAYQHITSPIAFYIKNCPKVPLIKDVHLKKPLNNASSIPKIVKNSKEHKSSNKENISLPPVAYKSAKQTKMISVPDMQKLPSNQWVEKMSNSLPKPVVIKHGHREERPNTSQYSTSKSEESFVGLPLKQADLSVCTKKSAYTKIA